MKEWSSDLASTPLGNRTARTHARTKETKRNETISRLDSSPNLRLIQNETNSSYQYHMLRRFELEGYGASMNGKSMQFASFRRRVVDRLLRAFEWKSQSNLPPSDSKLHIGHIPIIRHPWVEKSAQLAALLRQVSPPAFTVYSTFPQVNKWHSITLLVVNDSKRHLMTLSRTLVDKKNRHAMTIHDPSMTLGRPKKDTEGHEMNT